MKKKNVEHPDSGGSAHDPPPARPTPERDAVEGRRYAINSDLFATCRDELYEIAVRCLERARGDTTFQPTELLHEAYLSIATSSVGHTFNEHEFRCYIATVMRNILITNARRRRTLKRGGEWRRVDLDIDDIGQTPPDESDLLRLEEAMRSLEASEPRAARVAELKIYGSMDFSQISLWLDISTRTAQLDWRFAKAWLTREVSEADRDE